MSNDTPARWLTTAQAATALHVTPKTIRRRIERGELEARKVARDGGGIVWLVQIGNRTPIETDTEHPSKRTPIERVTPSEEDTEEDMGAERKGHEENSDRVNDLRDEVKFLRGVIEQLQRDGAEAHAEHRAALKLIGAAQAPQLEAGAVAVSGREQIARADTLPSVTPDDGQRPAKRQSGPLTIAQICDELDERLGANK